MADRGEIARRVFATCRLVGIETVAVYSDVDTDAPHVNEADYAVHLEGSTPATTYLEQHALIAAAKRAGANAVHPGNGSLAEDPEFAAAVTDAGMIWVGPPAATLRTLHRKSETKKLVAEAKVPVLPTFTDPATVPGFPVLIKPDAGIGGTGMRVVRDASTLAEAVASTRREVDGDVFCEPYVANVRHIEVPILADAMGAVVPFGERECSVQRRYQKIVEETPSPAVDAALREDLCRAAIVAVRALGFVGAGAVEFLLDSDGDFWFLELTPTLQTDHAVTECTSGYDLVRLQLLIAEGGSLPMPGPPPIRGHAIEVRICAEDPAYAWLPSAGTLHRFAVPDVAGSFRPLPQPGLRLDSGVADGSVTGPHHHDPMLAKLVAWAPSRQEAARMLASALARAQLHGVVTNRDLLVRTLRHHSFRSGDIDTGFLDRHPEVFAPLLSSVDAVRLSCLASALAGAADRRASAPVLSTLPSGWRNVPSGSQTAVYDGPTGPVEVGYRMNRHGELAGWWVRSVDPEELDLAGLGQAPVDEHPPIVVVSASRDRVVLNVQGIRLAVLVHRVGDVSYVDSPEGSVTLREIPRFPLPAPEAAESSLIAPLPGAVRRVLVVPGQRVRAGELLLTLEAMKLEHPVHAPSAGVVASLPVHPGAEVDTGELLAVLDPE
ncbi:acetyl/propionyl-CoA carboxylase subuit alpha [Actinoplanes cyaneus]|uniref:Acetyl/propionyl-CoA carboxylase subuit alpha n=1 Tax=Actinoplanes cyaneus TaxID=52696 RepID=A0A919IQP1_9ACTN|nr:propionyl-CoA carboxylase alpha chain [Actinoplanes cyaneus]GID69999.1 acetyl/propionyl-CoA carboxylase subuit alpha [Actinoplanes cyaneus]